MRYSDFFESIKQDYTYLCAGYYKRNKGATGIHKSAEFLKWDKLNHDIEVFRCTGEHLGSVDPITKAFYKGSKHRPINFNIVRLMTSMVIKKQKWCCDLMPTFLEDPIVPISYDPILREFSIDLADKMVRQSVFFCPWCGRRLPDSLRGEYFDVLEEEYGIEPDMDILKNEKLPQDFRSDIWWKKRNL